MTCSELLLFYLKRYTLFNYYNKIIAAKQNVWPNKTFVKTDVYRYLNAILTYKLRKTVK